MLTTSPLVYPVTCNPSLKEDGFGIIAHGVNPNELSPEDLIEVKRLLYTHSLVLFPNATMTPKGQYELTKAFDPEASVYGHGATVKGQKASILHPDLKTLPNQTQVQLIGNGKIYNPAITQGLALPVQLKHPSHESFHKTVVAEEERAAGVTRFYRWHIDAALYNLDPPHVTTLYGLELPKGVPQVVRYDDGTGDELPVSLGGTSFVSGRKMFELLSPALKSLAVRATVQYSPHPYVWMTPAKAKSTGLGIESEGKEVRRDELPPFEQDKIKTYPMLWKNPVTGGLHFQVHPCGVKSLIVAPLPAGTEATSDTLYPEGTHLTNLKEVRDLLYTMQRPAIAPEYVYTHDWNLNDLVLFHNRGVLHTVTGSFKPEEPRAFWQCNLAANDGPVPPSTADIKQYA